MSDKFSLLYKNADAEYDETRQGYIGPTRKTKIQSKSRKVEG